MCCLNQFLQSTKLLLFETFEAQMDVAVVAAFAFLCVGCAKVTSQCMFVSTMAFFARISDPGMGGTYMTLLRLGVR